MRRVVGRGALVGLGLVVACGGSAPPAQAPEAPQAHEEAEESASTRQASQASQAGDGPSAAAERGAAQEPTPARVAAAVTPPPDLATEEPYHDPHEKAGTIDMPALFDKKVSKSAFPKSTIGDRDCWSTLSVTGQHDRDYQSIVAACGAPTGLVEYARPVVGQLHHKHDPRDVYRVRLLGGYCYRYFAVADAGIRDLDVLIEKPGGALVGDDKTSSPVAIIESDHPWCIDQDETLEFHVQVDGPGRGGYAFGVWARPKK